MPFRFPRDKAHCGHGCLCNDESCFSIKVKLFIQRHHQWKCNKVCRCKVTCQDAETADEGCQNHNNDYIHLVSEFCCDSGNDRVEYTGFCKHLEIQKCKQEHKSSRFHHGSKLFYDESTCFFYGMPKNQCTKNRCNEKDKVKWKFFVITVATTMRIRINAMIKVAFINKSFRLL